ncbi:MAG: aminotransferase class IV [Solirubrobacteraceae bacterium]
MRPDPSQGVFETMLVRQGRVHALGPHLARLSHSVGALYGMSLPRDLPGRVRDHSAGLPGEHRLRVDAVPGQTVEITTRPVAPGYRHPVTLEPFVIPGGLGPHKWRDRRSLDIAARYRGATLTRGARAGAGAGAGAGWETAPLLIDADGTVLEAAWGNLWLLEGDRLVTPPADGRILPGVTRALLLARAPSLGLRAAEEPITLERARAAPVAFATSAIRLAVPVGIAGTPAPPAAPVDRIRAALS